MSTILGGWKIDLKVRSEKDWEEKEGRVINNIQKK